MRTSLHLSYLCLFVCKDVQNSSNSIFCFVKFNFVKKLAPSLNMGFVSWGILANEAGLFASLLQLCFK